MITDQAPTLERALRLPGSRSRNQRRGAALLFALVIAVIAAAASAGVLMVSTHFTQRQVSGVHDQRAFYLAEAGLSEAYQALSSGQSGQVGSIDAPAIVGDGLVWVDATPDEDGNVMLRSTGLAGIGRASLALLVERVEEPLGVFAGSSLAIDAPILVDGYNSKLGSYTEQLEPPGTVLVPRDETELDRDEDPPEGAFLVDFEQVEFLVLGEDETHYSLSLFDTDDEKLPDAIEALLDIYGGTGPVIDMPIDWDAYAKDLEEVFEKRGLTYPVSGDPEGGWAEGGGKGEGVSGRHTASGGKLASNGEINFGEGSGSQIFGDVVPGPGSVVEPGGAYIRGFTSSSGQRVSLDPVIAPTLEVQPGISHSGATPLVIPPTTISYAGLNVHPDAEVILRGPSKVVFGDLALEAGALLTIDNIDGRVDVYVHNSLDLALGSYLSVENPDPTQMTLRLVGEVKAVVLGARSDFYGMIYGPEAAIRIESPFEVFGILAGNELSFAAGTRMHFDHGIAGGGDELPIPRLLSWDVTEVPAGVSERSMDPVEALGLSAAALLPPQDAVERTSWYMRASFRDKDGVERRYDGPFEDFDYKSYHELSIPLGGMLAPADRPAEWEFDVHYEDFGGGKQKYKGPAPGLPVTQVAVITKLKVKKPKKLKKEKAPKL